MILSQLNYVAVAVSAIAYFALGAIYFNPKVAGKAWMEGHNLGNPTEEDKKNMGKIMGITFIYCLFASVGIGCIVQIIKPTSYLVAAKIGLLCSLFSALSIAMSYLYTKKSFQIVVIDSVYHIIGMIIASIIQVAWL